MSIRLAVAGVLAALTVAARPGAAQQAGTPPDSTTLQLRTTLRAFYFSLAHHDWQALSADILPAKVVAHRPAPEVLAAVANTPASPAHLTGSAPTATDSPPCSADATPLVDQAVITIDGDWARVYVPRCGATPAEGDEFRFIHFDGRWRIVHIRLVHQLPPEH